MSDAAEKRRRQEVAQILAHSHLTLERRVEETERALARAYERGFLEARRNMRIALGLCGR